MADDPRATPGAGGQDASSSQEEIDAALAAGGAGGASAGGSSPDTPAELGQADIDAVLAAAGDSGAADEALAADDSGSAQEASANADSGAVNQADVDALIAGSVAGGAEGGSEDGLLTQEDIDASLAGGALPAATPSAEPDQRLDSAGRPFDQAAAAMAAAIEEEKAAEAAAAPPKPAGEPVGLPDFAPAQDHGGLSQDIDLLHDVNLQVKIELGRTRMLVEDVLKLGDGSVVELDKLAGDPVDVFANDRLIARGEVLVLNDSFCVRVSEIMSGHAGDI